MWLSICILNDLALYHMIIIILMIHMHCTIHTTYGNIVIIYIKQDGNNYNLCRGGTGLIQVVGLYWKIIAYMVPLDPKLIHALLIDPEKVVELCLQIVKVVGLKPHQPLCRSCYA